MQEEEKKDIYSDKLQTSNNNNEREELTVKQIDQKFEAESNEEEVGFVLKQMNTNKEITRNQG